MQTKLDGHQTSFFLVKQTDRSIVSHRRKGGVAALVDSLYSSRDCLPHGLTWVLYKEHEYFRELMYKCIQMQVGIQAQWKTFCGVFQGFIIQLLLDSEACRDRGCCRNALLALKQRCSSKTYEMWARFGESFQFHFSSLGYFGCSFWYDAYAGIEVALLC